MFIFFHLLRTSIITLKIINIYKELYSGEKNKLIWINHFELLNSRVIVLHVLPMYVYVCTYKRYLTKSLNRRC